VGIINAAFSPTEAEVARARRLIASFENEGRGAIVVDGVMVDRPAVETARRLLERASAAHTPTRNE
jgi:citrate lyase beta subunit